MAKLDGEWAHEVYVANNVRHARTIIAKAEADLGLLTRGQCVDLLCDNTSWSLADCTEAVNQIFFVDEQEG